MTPSEIRDELLAQHARLRSLMDEVRHVAERAARGEPVGGELREGVSRVAEVLREHNQREEDLLRAIIPTVDAWGPARAEIMDETHQREHDDLHQALLGVGERPHAFAGAGVRALFDRILEHLAREEKIFLAEELLKEDTVIVEFGG